MSVVFTAWTLRFLVFASVTDGWFLQRRSGRRPRRVARVIAGRDIDVAADVRALKLDVHRPGLEVRLPRDLVRYDVRPE